MAYYRSASDEDRGTVYFVRSGDLVKIGFTKNLEHRLRAMRTDNPGSLEVLWADAGSPLDERAYHVVFREYRVRNEWFRYEGHLKEYLECEGMTPELEEYANRPLPTTQDTTP